MPAFANSVNIILLLFKLRDVFKNKQNREMKNNEWNEIIISISVS